MKKKKLYIIGTKILAEMLRELSERCGYATEGFFDDTSTEQYCSGKPIVGPVNSCLSQPSQYKDAVFAVAIGDNSGRATICTQLMNAGLNLPILIDPQATKMPSATIGLGSIIFAHSYVGTGSVLGRGNLLLPGTVITHHTTIGDYNFFAPGVSVGGHTRIESYTKYGMNSVIASHSTIPDNYACPPLTYVNK